MDSFVKDGVRGIFIPISDLPARVDEDLDSITLGSPSKCQIKVYYNTKLDSSDVIAERLNKAINEAKMAMQRMTDEGLIGGK